MSSVAATRDAAIKSQIGKKRKRTLSSKNPSAKKKKSNEKSKKRIADLKPFTVDDLKAVQSFFSNVLFFAKSTGNLALFNGLTQKVSQYFQFPIVTEEPHNKGDLSGIDYFLGCDSVSTIEYVLRTVYYERYGGDSGLLEHEKWSLYKYNQMYYGTKAFTPKINEPVLRDLHAKTRPYGGSELPPYPNIAEQALYKTVRPYLVPLEKYFGDFPDRLPKEFSENSRFLPFADLEKINLEIKKKKEDLLLENDITTNVSRVPSDEDDADTADEEELSDDEN